MSGRDDYREAFERYRKAQADQEFVEQTRRAKEAYDEFIRNAFRARDEEAQRTRRRSFTFPQDEVYGSRSSTGITADQLKAVFRKLANKWHPDKGGTTEAMQALNEAHEEFKKLA